MTALEKAAIVYARLDRAFHLLDAPTPAQRRVCLQAYRSFMEAAFQTEMRLRGKKP